MKVVQINTFSNKSTGTIMMNIHKYISERGIESYVVWGRGRKSNNKYELFINDKIGIYYHGMYTRLTDKTGFASKRATTNLLKQLDRIKPDIIHLHNLHGYYINLEMLFGYIKNNKIKVLWTFHDCWPFTGHCAHFEVIGCEKWKEQCYNCPQLNTYPKSFIDNSKWNYLKKKELFSDLDMTIVTPSEWLEKLVKKSFLNSYSTKIIKNGIDLETFKIVKSNFKEKYNIIDKKIILGVASTWTDLKGYSDFIKLAERIDEEYVIVLVGLDKKQISTLSTNIIGIERTESVQELVSIYNAADIYFNPTYADNYPTTNLEALACGTPVITYNTGGSPECINENNGIITNFEDFCNNYKTYVNKKYIINCDENINKNNMLKTYLDLYQEVKNK